jgi:hypothetical protein
MSDFADNSISQREIVWGRSILCVFLLCISLPYLLAKLLVPEGMNWSGLLFSADDQNVHLMWARQVRDGTFFMRDLYTTQSLIAPEPALFFNILPYLMGIFSRFTGLEVVIWYHIFRVGLAGVAIWQLHRLGIAVTQGKANLAGARICVLALAAFTSGAGFLAPFLPSIAIFDRPDGSILPLVPEAFLSLSAFAYPLNIASFALLAYIWCQIIEEKRPVQVFIAAIFLGNIHTYDSLPLMVAALVGCAINRNFSRVALTAFIGSLLPVLYQFLVFRGSEEFRLKALTLTEAPLAISLFLTFLPLIALALISFKSSRELPASRWLLAWLFSTLVLLYLPASVFSFSRKMIEGLQLPLLVFAGIGVWSIAQKISKPRAQWICGAIVVLLAASPAQFISWTMNNFSTNNEGRWGVLMPPLMLTDSEKILLEELEKKPQGAVLCLPFLGSYVPRISGKFTYYGHWAESLKVEEEKRPRTIAFYTGQMSPDEAKQFLKENKISYVLESGFERGISKGNSMPTTLGLPIEFSTGEDKIYSVPTNF